MSTYSHHESLIPDSQAASGAAGPHSIHAQASRTISSQQNAFPQSGPPRTKSCPPEEGGQQPAQRTFHHRSFVGPAPQQGLPPQAAIAASTPQVQQISPSPERASHFVTTPIPAHHMVGGFQQVHPQQHQHHHQHHQHQQQQHQQQQHQRLHQQHQQPQPIIQQQGHPMLQYSQVQAAPGHFQLRPHHAGGFIAAGAQLQQHTAQPQLQPQPQPQHQPLSYMQFHTGPPHFAQQQQQQQHLTHAHAHPHPHGPNSAVFIPSGQQMAMGSVPMPVHEMQQVSHVYFPGPSAAAASMVSAPVQGLGPGTEPVPIMPAGAQQLAHAHGHAHGHPHLPGSSPMGPAGFSVPGMHGHSLSMGMGMGHLPAPAPAPAPAPVPRPVPKKSMFKDADGRELSVAELVSAPRSPAVTATATPAAPAAVPAASLSLPAAASQPVVTATLKLDTQKKSKALAFFSPEEKAAKPVAAPAATAPVASSPVVAASAEPAVAIAVSAPAQATPSSAPASSVPERPTISRVTSTDSSSSSSFSSLAPSPLNGATPASTPAVHAVEAPHMDGSSMSMSMSLSMSLSLGAGSVMHSPPPRPSPSVAAVSGASSPAATPLPLLVLSGEASDLSLSSSLKPKPSMTPTPPPTPVDARSSGAAAAFSGGPSAIPEEQQAVVAEEKSTAETPAATATATSTSAEEAPEEGEIEVGDGDEAVEDVATSEAVPEETKNEHGQYKYSKKFLLSLRYREECTRPMAFHPEIQTGSAPSPRGASGGQWQQGHAAAGGARRGGRGGGGAGHQRGSSMGSMGGKGSSGGSSARAPPTGGKQSSTPSTKPALLGLFGDDSPLAVTRKEATLILNKITRTTFDVLSKKLIELIKSSSAAIRPVPAEDGSTEAAAGQPVGGEMLQLVVSQVFIKALIEGDFAELYSELCSVISKQLIHGDFFDGVNKLTGEPKSIFRRVLLEKCQAEFKEVIKPVDPANKSPDEVLELEFKQKHKMLGYMRFIGELFLRGLVGPSIMFKCLGQLLDSVRKRMASKQVPEEELRSFCKLINTVGKKLETTANAPVNDEQTIKFREQFKDFYESLSRLSTDKNLPSKLRFEAMDSCSLRKNNWASRAGGKPEPAPAQPATAPAQFDQLSPTGPGSQDFRHRIKSGDASDRFSRLAKKAPSPTLGPAQPSGGAPGPLPHGPAGAGAAGAAAARGKPAAAAVPGPSPTRMAEPAPAPAPAPAPPAFVLDKKADYNLRRTVQDYINDRDMKEALEAIKEINIPAEHAYQIPLVILRWYGQATPTAANRLAIDLLAELIATKTGGVNEDALQHALATLIPTLPDEAPDYPKMSGCLGTAAGLLVRKERCWVEFMFYVERLAESGEAEHFLTAFFREIESAPDKVKWTIHGLIYHNLPKFMRKPSDADFAAVRAWAEKNSLLWVLTVPAKPEPQPQA